MLRNRKRMITVGKIARRLGQPVHRVEYVLRSRNIRPVAIAGNARVFSENTVDAVSKALRDMDLRRERSER